MAELGFLTQIHLEFLWVLLVKELQISPSTLEEPRCVVSVWRGAEGELQQKVLGMKRSGQPQAYGLDTSQESHCPHLSHQLYSDKKRPLGCPSEKEKGSGETGKHVSPCL